jgi:hypothetical protein
LANDGLQIQTSLRSWSKKTTSWIVAPGQKSNSFSGASNSILAKVYYHAITIFLSGLFDYRQHWAASDQPIHVPTLNQSEVQQHVTEILDTTQNALEKTNMVGVLFFFPLRVAGARARIQEQKLQILELLRRISKANFVAADAFVEDLTQLWGVP